MTEFNQYTVSKQKRVVPVNDSLELLPFIRANSFDVVITDPLYDYSDTYKSEILSQFLRIATDWVIIFAPWNNRFPDDPEWYDFVKYQEAFWIKPQTTKNTRKSYANYVEVIQIYKVNDDAYWDQERHISNRSNIFFDRVTNFKEHTWQKPYSLIETLMLNHVKPGDSSSVFDPFAGSGVVGEVAEKHKILSLLWDNFSRT